MKFKTTALLNTIILWLFIALLCLALGYAWRMQHETIKFCSHNEHQVDSVHEFIETQPAIAIDMTVPKHIKSRKNMTKRN